MFTQLLWIVDLNLLEPEELERFTPELREAVDRTRDALADR